MNNKFAAMGLLALSMTTCSTPAVGQQNNVLDYVSAPARASIVQSINEANIKQAKIEAKLIAYEKLVASTTLMNKTVKKLKSHVNKTWYVFSGTTPSGWDCSGLVLWFYEQQGITLEHRASKQDTSGKATKYPKAGDIVVFKYKGSKDAYHVGIYYKDGLMIHAPKHGHTTRIESIEDFAGSYSKVSYRTLIKTN